MGLFDRFRAGGPAPLPAFLPMPAVRAGGPARPGVRRYDAAQPDRLAGGFSTFGPSYSTAEILRQDLRGLMAHSRKLAANSDYMKAFLAMVRRHVIGPAGIRLQVRAKNADGSLDKGANAILQDAFARWGRKGSPTIDRRLSWWDVEQIAVSTVARDGNFFAIEHTGASAGPFGYRLQLVDAALLDYDLVMPLAGGAFIRGGIEYTGAGEPVAYHFLSRSADGINWSARGKVRVPADRVIHLFRQLDPDQQHGEPWAHTAARRIAMIGGFEEAAITAARTGAAKMGFFTRLPNPDVDEEFPVMDGPEISAVEPGEFETLPAGWDFKMFDPGYPQDIAPFLKAVLRGAASGLGVSYNGLANDLEGVNFSSLRDGRGEERDEWRTLQTWVIESLHERVFSAWLKMALLTPETKPLPYRLEKFDAPWFRPRGWASVNPVDDANANETELRNGLRSPQDIVAERGDDLAEIYAQIAEAKAMAKAAGLEFTPSPAGNAKPSAVAAEAAATAAAKKG